MSRTDKEYPWPPLRSNGNKNKVSIDIKGAKEVDQMVGVLFSEVKDDNRDDLISKLFTMKIIVGCCGKEYTYNFKTFPREDLKCDCGKKGRWVVKYE
jgi:hypothetical protein